MSGHHGGAALGTACMAMLACLSLGAMARTPSPDQAITTAQQAPRDTERLRILQDELARERGLAAEAALRRAERIAAADARGAQDAELAIARAKQNVDALQREIQAAATAVARQANVEPTATPSPAAQPVSARSHAMGQGPRWWDVYAKPPHSTNRETASVAPAVIPPPSVRPAPPQAPLTPARHQVLPRAAGGGNHVNHMEATR